MYKFNLDISLRFYLIFGSSSIKYRERDTKNEKLTGDNWNWLLASLKLTTTIIEILSTSNKLIIIVTLLFD